MRVLNKYGKLKHDFCEHFNILLPDKCKYILNTPSELDKFLKKLKTMGDGARLRKDGTKVTCAD